MDWRYDTAQDIGLPLIERLKRWPREPDPLVHATRFLSALAIRAALNCYNRLEIAGRSNLPREGSFVLVANHASHLDTAALLSALPLWSLNHAYPLAARDYFCANKARVALATIVANVMLFDRDERGLVGLNFCRQLLAEPANVLLMFPEGTRSTDGNVGIFKRGIGLLVAGTRYPVVPCHIDGTFRALPKGALTLRPARVRISIGEVRTYERATRDDAGLLEVCADLRRSVLAQAERRSQARLVAKKEKS